MAIDALDHAGLLVVTGKGGVGKTTVAAALAVAAALRGRRALVAEVEGRQGLAEVFGVAQLGYDEAPVAGGVTGLAVDPEASLREYLARFGVGPLARLLSWAHISHLITAVIPGLADILLIGKMWEAVTRRRDGRPVYDLVVLDAPPTGRVVPFLSALETVAELARVGPIRGQAERVERLLHDPARTRVLVVTLPEELPATETVEARSALRAAGLPLGPVVVNQVAGDRLGGRARRLAALARNPAPMVDAARAAGAALDEHAVRALVEEARQGQRQVARQRRLIQELRRHAGDDGLVELPLLPGGVDGPAAVRALAERLAAPAARRQEAAR